ncbi:hypothetical protein T484DRAFT_1810256, partial [Baffinella frigidus]
MLGIGLVLLVALRVTLTKAQQGGSGWMVHHVLVAGAMVAFDFFLLGTSSMFSDARTLAVGFWPSASLFHKVLTCI